MHASGGLQAARQINRGLSDQECRPPGALASRSDISCSAPRSAVALPGDAARLNETRTLYKFPIKISIIHFHAIFFFPGVHIGGREKETLSTLSQGIGFHGLSEEATRHQSRNALTYSATENFLPKITFKGLKDKNKLKIPEMLTLDECEVIQISAYLMYMLVDDDLH